MVSDQLCSGIIWKSSTLETGLAVFPEAAAVLCHSFWYFPAGSSPWAVPAAGNADIEAFPVHLVCVCYLSVKNQCAGQDW